MRRLVASTSGNCKKKNKFINEFLNKAAASGNGKNCKLGKYQFLKYWINTLDKTFFSTQYLVTVNSPVPVTVV